MPRLDNTVFDAALTVITANTENLYLTSQEATTYAEAATTYKLATKATPGFTGPADGDTSGRKVTVNAISDGTVNTTGNATHWALTDDSESTLVAAGALSGTVALTANSMFNLAAFDIEIKDPVSE